jgi:hypothetical protein
MFDMVNTLSVIKDQAAGLSVKDRIRLIQSLLQDFAEEENDDFDEGDEEEITAILEDRLDGPSQGVENVPAWAQSVRDHFKGKPEALIASTRHG